MRSQQTEILSGFVCGSCDGQLQTIQTTHSFSLFNFLARGLSVFIMLLCSFCLFACLNAEMFFLFPRLFSIYPFLFMCDFIFLGFFFTYPKSQFVPITVYFLFFYDFEMEMSDVIIYETCGPRTRA